MNGASMKLSAMILISLIICELSALRIAAIQTGIASVQHHHGSGAALRAQLRSFGKMRLRKRVRLFGPRLELLTLLLHQFALMDVEFRLLQQPDRLQVTLDHVTQLGDGGGHEFSPGLPIAAARIEHRLELVDQEGGIAALAKYRRNDPRQCDDPLEMIEILRIDEHLERTALFMRSALVQHDVV